MGELTGYFFDTYAFYEIIEGNVAFEKYTKEIGIITTKLNLMELHYGLLRLYGKETADSNYDRFSKFAIEIEDNTIKEANTFKLKNKNNKLSFVDCIGYMIAKQRGVKFLTGDKEFKDIDGVEFIP